MVVQLFKIAVTADTPVRGFIDHQTWVATNSPYTAPNDLIVNNLFAAVLPTRPDTLSAVSTPSDTTNSSNVIETVSLVVSNLPSYLPVYQVTQKGATFEQAMALATYLGISTNAIAYSNGVISFIDSSNWMAVPSITLTNTKDPAVSNLLAGSPNPYPAIPIQVEAIDFATLTNLPVFDTKEALDKTSNALAHAGLYPRGARPLTGHTIFTVFMTNVDQTVSSAHQYLDTLIAYQPFVSAGSNTYPVVGQGAQLQIDYGPTGNVTRLYYGTPRLTAGPLANVMSETEASNRIARAVETNATFTLRLVYWAPTPLPQSIPAVTTLAPTNIIPWYEVIIDHPPPAPNATKIVEAKMIPATEDLHYVPRVKLSVSQPGSQIAAKALVTGGWPPYRYTWGGSSPDVCTNLDASIRYTPLVRIAIPSLSITMGPEDNTVNALWPSPSTGFILESSTNLAIANWTRVASEVQTNKRFTEVKLPATCDNFLRLRLASQTLPVTDTVAVTVTDANGVSASTSLTLSTFAVPVVSSLSAANSANQTPSVMRLGASYQPTFGTISPFDAYGLDLDTAGWVQTMVSLGMKQSFVVLQHNAWPGDFIEPSLAGTEEAVMPSSPTTAPVIYAAADSGFGVNNANIVYFLGHGAPYTLTFTYPKGPINNPVMNGQPNLGVLAGDSFLVFYPNFQFSDMMYVFFVDWASDPQYPGGYDYYFTKYTENWGWLNSSKDSLYWLVLESCNVLQYNPTNEFDTTPPGPNVYYAGQQWGPQFNGLHSMLGYNTEGAYPAGTPALFASLILNHWNVVKFPRPITITQAWMLANRLTMPYATAPSSVGGFDYQESAAAMGLVGLGGAYNLNDYFLSVGNMGPTIARPMSIGWWYINTFLWVRPNP